MQHFSTKQERRDLLFRKLELLAKEQNHLISNFEFENYENCSFSVCCKTHHTTHPLIHSRNYASPNLKWGVLCCACPVSIETKDKRLKRQIKNRLSRWKRMLCPSKAKRWCCEVTGLMSQNVIKDGAKLNVEAHHLYAAERYPNVMFIKQNGILILNIFHLEFHKKMRNACDITPDSFLLFLKQLRTNGADLLSCLKELRKSLIKNILFEERVPCVHPVTAKAAYNIMSKTGQGNASVIVPCSLLDNDLI